MSLLASPSSRIASSLYPPIVALPSRSPPLACWLVFFVLLNMVVCGSDWVALDWIQYLCSKRRHRTSSGESLGLPASVPGRECSRLSAANPPDLRPDHIACLSPVT